MTKKNNTRESEIENRFEEIEESLTKTEQFIEKNQKQIILTVLFIIGLVLGVFGFNKFYKAPQEKKAQVAIFKAQELFNNGEYKKALEGIQEVGNQTNGFLYVLDKYSGTKAGELAIYYAGVCHKNIGEYDKAIEKLNDFKTEDFLLKSVAQITIGDAYFEKGSFNEASSAYKKATELNPNNFTTPIAMFRLGLTYEKLNDNAKAIEIYNSIKEKYPYSEQGRNIDKYIARIQSQQAK